MSAEAARARYITETLRTHHARAHLSACATAACSECSAARLVFAEYGYTDDDLSPEAHLVGTPCQGCGLPAEGFYSSSPNGYQWLPWCDACTLAWLVVAAAPSHTRSALP